MSAFAVLIFCDAPSHPTKVARVKRIALGDDGRLYSYIKPQPRGGGEQFVTDDDGRPWALNSKTGGEQWVVETDDGQVTAPRHIDSRNAGRRRWKLTCPLCGLPVQMREETALRLVEGWAAAGIQRIRMSELAVTLNDQ
jgi:hypothetical protein